MDKLLIACVVEGVLVLIQGFWIQLLLRDRDKLECMLLSERAKALGFVQESEIRREKNEHK
jgi:hypothetical protein